MEQIFPKKGLIGREGFFSEFDYIITDYEKDYGDSFQGVIAIYDDAYSRIITDKDNEEYERDYRIIEKGCEALEYAASDICNGANGNLIEDSYITPTVDIIMRHPGIVRQIIFDAITQRLGHYGGIHLRVSEKELANNICRGCGRYVGVKPGEILTGDEFGERFKKQIMVCNDCPRSKADQYKSVLSKWVKMVYLDNEGEFSYILKR